MDETLASEIGDTAAGCMYLENTHRKVRDEGYLARLFRSYRTADLHALGRHPSMFGKVAA